MALGALALCLWELAQANDRLDRIVDHDAEAIRYVARAEPGRVAALSADVRAFLAQRPLRAAGRGAGYRARKFLQRNRYETGGLRSKDWSEFAQAGAPHMNFVLTVCDKAAGEVCPVWPGQPMSAHWGVADPAEVGGSDDQQQKAFTDAFMTLRTRVGLLVNLPIDKLDRLSLQSELNSIARQPA